MKTALATLIFVLATSAHAAGPHGGAGLGALGGAYGMNAHAAASSHAAANGAPGQSGQGGSYWAPRDNASLVDAYQPWSESEMRSFQKP